ncbi:unnamed protein product [Merluccius merluccius]
MPTGKPQAKLAAATASEKDNLSDHAYAEMEVTATGAWKRKDPPGTPTKNGTPPTKVKAPQEPSAVSNEALVKAIDKLTDKMDTFSVQLRENSVMVANISKIVEINAAEIKECKEKIQAVKKEMPRLIKENEELKEKVTEMERYKRRWNLKMHGLKEKDDERIRDIIMEILSKIAPQWASSMQSMVDTVHRLGRREEGKHRQIIMQFTMRHHRDEFWKLSKNCRICKELGIHFKQDFCKADREARAAAWPKMEQARVAGNNVYFRGHVGYINGNRVALD